MRSILWTERRYGTGRLFVIAGLMLAWQAFAVGQEPEDASTASQSPPEGQQARLGGFDRPDMRGAPPGRERFPFVSPEQTEQLMEFLEEHFPKRHRLLRRLQEHNPEAFEHRVSELAPRVLELLLRTREDPELGELLIEQQRLEEDLRELVREYRALDAEAEVAREGLKGQIEEIVARMVDIGLERREHEIAALERRLQRQREMLQEDLDNREQMVAEHLQAALERGPGGRWMHSRRGGAGEAGERGHHRDRGGREPRGRNRGSGEEQE
ncbi:MAG: OmpH family outer membrane protein [Phycisphaerales bacterium]|nr:MAG: OmpH family outer membrane protein [Phycisphaerales bacterium]